MSARACAMPRADIHSQTLTHKTTHTRAVLRNDVSTLCTVRRRWRVAYGGRVRPCRHTFLGDVGSTVNSPCVRSNNKYGVVDRPLEHTLRSSTLWALLASDSAPTTAPVYKRLLAAFVAQFSSVSSDVNRRAGPRRPVAFRAVEVAQPSAVSQKEKAPRQRVHNEPGARVAEPDAAATS
ncbi:hypothetical protein EVAR_31861_1 [Eumeta japonica]|uniref:Uncharacterized protein n=1 Tax=Eumeta variegata TaxID=151549 RepID=A0A4C1Z5V9_EUMVA|nr:hypothetical protein EVAR_31861_1 [Eumeta japonica]